MARSGHWRGRPFSRRISEWKAVGGTTKPDGTTVEKPQEVVEAQIVDGLARRWGQTPATVRQQPVEDTLKLLSLVAAGEEGDKAHAAE